MRHVCAIRSNQRCDVAPLHPHCKRCAHTHFAQCVQCRSSEAQYTTTLTHTHTIWLGRVYPHLNIKQPLTPPPSPFHPWCHVIVRPTIIVHLHESQSNKGGRERGDTADMTLIILAFTGETFLSQLVMFKYQELIASWMLKRHHRQKNTCSVLKGT